jgi:KaiC/GvpD/RAD55 family RecA-like ATPase
MYTTGRDDGRIRKDIFLIECPVCRTQISSAATRCYLCGNYVDRQRVEEQISSRYKPEGSRLQPQAQEARQPRQPVKPEPRAEKPEQKEIDALKAALEREQKDKSILKSELEIKSADIRIFEEQVQRLKKLEQIKEMLDSTILEKNRLAEELEYQKKRVEEQTRYLSSMMYLENEVDRKEAFIQELLEEKTALQDELVKYKTLKEELDEKKKNVTNLKNELTDMKDRLKHLEVTTKREDALQGIRTLLESETKRKEKLEKELRQLENVRSMLKKEKQEKEKLQSELDLKDREIGEMEKLSELWDAEKKECMRLRDELSRKDKVEGALKAEELKRKSLEDTVALRDEKVKAQAEELEKLNEKLDNLKKLETVLNDERGEKERMKGELKDSYGYIQNLERRLVELENTIPTVRCPACNSPIPVAATTCPSCGAAFSEGLISVESKTGQVEINVEELQQRQVEIEKREKETGELQKELQEKVKLYEGKWDTMKYKEEELTRRENEIAIKTGSMEDQIKFLKSLKSEMKDTSAMVKLNEELNQLKSELRIKEETLRDRERHLSLKMRELEIKESEMGSARFDAYEITDVPVMASKAASSGKKGDKLVVKIKSGVPRLDDLLYGGFPAGSNILLSGPNFIGKETLCNLFISEGLNRDVPCLYITVDENYTKILARIAEIVPNCNDCEKKDAIKYLDLYTIRTNPSLVSMRHPENVEFLENLRDVEALSIAINKTLDMLSKKGKYYRLVFPISTLLMNMDAMAVIKFLEPINARVKMDSSVALYNINPGLHAERDVEMVRHIMDGTIDFRLTDVRKSFSIHGISNVQTRTWIEYNNTETSLIIGSFTVEKIK